MARKNRQIMTSVCQAFPGERKQDIRNMRSSCRTSLLGVLSIYLLLAPAACQQESGWMRQKALENCPPNLQANAEGKANPAFLDMISRESDLREKLRQYDTIKRAITAIDESVISKSTTMMRTSSEPEPLKIMLVYRLDELESDGMKKKADLLREEIMPRVAGEFARRMKVKRPTVGPLKLVHPCDSSIVVEVLKQTGVAYPRAKQTQIEITQTLCYSFLTSADYCGPPELGINHDPNVFNEFRICNSTGACYLHYGDGVEADFVLYVTSKTKGCMGGDNVAFSSPCYMSTNDARPLAGYVNFCADSIRPDAVDSLVETGIHEVMHSLFFNDALFDYFVDANGNTLGRNKVVRNATSGGAEVISPNAVRQAKFHWDCPTLKGVPLENQGGCGTSSSHWESRYMEGELMVGQAANNIAYSRRVWSAITMGLAQDSGWYVPDYKEAQILQFGRGAGCDFVSSSCWGLLNQGDDEFFCRGSAPGCTADRLATSECKSIPFSGGCRSELPRGPESDCLNIEADAPYNFLSHGAYSRCMEAEALNVPSREADTSVCLRMSCLNSQLTLYVGGSPVECPAGGFLEIADISGEGLVRIGPCPESSEICPSLSCPADCSTNGRCLGGECQCFLGYAGEDCSKTVCWVDSCAEGEFCDLESGYCEVVEVTTPSPAEQGLPMPGFDNWPTPPAPPEPTSGPEYDYSDEEEAEEREEEEVEIEQVVEPAIQLGGSLMVIDPNTGTKQTLPWVTETNLTMSSEKAVKAAALANPSSDARSSLRLLSPALSILVMAAAMVLMMAA